MACIVRDKSFNQIVDTLDIHPDSLEEIIKEWRKDIKARQDAFPSIDYIREQISAKDNFVEEHLFEKATKIWQEKFSQPAIFDSREDAEAYREEANKFFVQDASYIKRTKDGKYEVTVSEPQETIESIEKEMQSIKDAAEKNGTFKKAPNGKDTNLTERQWLQVRTKNFKNWFGDWTKQFVVYQGRKSNKDSRRFNYYTIDKNEASKYGNNLESKTIDTTGMLSYFSNEYTKLSQEFYEKTGKRFDILDNSEDGLQTQNEFFEFIRSEGYTGFESLSEHPYLGKDFIENPYIVEFDNHKDSELISKVVDENGEPLVVYHGTDNKFDVFSNLFSIYTSNNEKMSDSYRYNEDSIEEDLYDFEEKEESYGLERDGARERFVGIITNSIDDVPEYLMDKMITDVEDFIEKKHPEYYLDMYGILRKKLIESGELENIAEEYAEFKRPRDVRKYYERKLGRTMRLFLNIKNPLIVDAGGSHWDSILFDGKKVTTRELEHFAENSGSDGFIVRNVKDYGEYTTSSLEDIPGYIYVAFNSNQAKSATENRGTFSTEDNNIYHEGEGTPNSGKRDTRLQELWDKNKTEETKMTELLSLIDRNSEFSGIIDLLKTKKDGRKSLLSDVKVKVVDTDVIKTRKNDFGGRRAYYNASEKTIYIDSSASYLNGNADSVILHEIMHAITVNRILGNSKFRAEFDKIIDEYNKNFRNYRYRKTTLAGKENSHYMEEFIADVWSDRNTIENLKSIKTNDNLTLWDKIKNFFTRIFAGSNGTLMAKASDAIYRLLDEPEMINAKDSEFAVSFKNGKYEVTVSQPQQTIESIEKEMQSIKDAAEKNGTFMKAPNGKPTNLNEKQWLQVRTKAFKNWFGDWENDPANASRVVDENGEPMVVYHGSDKIFNTFDVNKGDKGYYDYRNEKIPVDSERAMFFSSNPIAAKSYVLAKQGYHPTTIQQKLQPVDHYYRAIKELQSLKDDNFSGNSTKEIEYALLWSKKENFDKHKDLLPKDYNYIAIIGKRLVLVKGAEEYEIPSDAKAALINDIKNFLLGQIKRATSEQTDWDGNRISATDLKAGVYPVFLNIKNPFSFDYEGLGHGGKYKDKYPVEFINARQVNKAIKDGYDGVIYQNIYDPYLADNYGVFNPNQIKSAEANIGTFSTEDNNIYYEGNSDAEERNVPQAIRKTNEGYVKQSAKFNREVDNLLDGTLVSPLEVRDVAVQVAYKIHDIIGDLIDNPDKIFTEEKFSKQDEKNIEEAKKRIAGMSHKELVQYIGARNLLNYVRAQMFELPQGNWTFDMLDQADLYAANFDALIKIGMSTFSQIEGFGIVSNLATQESTNKNGVEDFSVIDDIGIDADDLTSSIDYDAILDEIGNIQEHWQIESRTIDVLNSATALVKDALGKCYIVRAVDTVDENGNKVRSYERMRSKWGVELRMTPRDATSSILRWARGSMNINDMIAKLKEKEDSNPWVHQIIEKLEDKSGDQTQFQSQFFKVFEKHFQIYSVVSWDNEKKKYVSKIVNERPALKEARDLIRNGYESGSSPIFTDKKVNTRALKELEDIYKDALKYRDARWDDIDDATREVLSNAISVFVNEFGYYISPELTLSSLNGNNFKNIVNTMGFIVANLKEGASLESNGKQYNPFKFGENYSISGNIKQLLSPLTEALEDTAITSFYDNGKMYQSYVTPSFLSKMFIQFGSDDASFKEFISKEYAGEDWFRDQSKDESVASSWRNVWLQVLSGMSEQERKEIFSHKVQLNFNRKSYMRGMSDTEYIMSFISEYFSAGKILDRDVAWYRIPIMSNKPSAEFIRFIRYSGPEYKSEIISGMKKIFNQEISRIQTVKMMEEQDSEVKISNLNEKGKDFQFLSFLNEERRNGTELGKLIDKKINGEATASDESRIDRLLSGYTDESGNFIIGAIQKGMDAKADEIIKEWRRIGIFDNLDSIEGINSGFANKEEAIRNFIWNDTFAAMNILQLTITDMALYSSAEDIQKRLAQLHSPGLMANEFATDFDGNLVCGDGTIKSIVLDDFEGVKSNIIENLSVVFDRKIKAARARGNEQEAKGWEVTKDSIIRQFEDINVTDGQAFKSISAARKNAFMFGTWTRENEALFNKLKNPAKYGEYTYQDVKNAFTQPRKPFAYGMISKQLDVENAPLSSIRKGVQYKNSEYLLILADAILKDEDTGMPNMLKVIADFMEMTYDRFGYDGIDTVMFKSCVKTGIGNTLNLNQFLGMNSKEGYDAAYKYLVDNVIVDGKYNDLYVDRLKIRDYSEQQDIPEHFKEHFQAFGSQLRYIIPSDLEVSDDNGNPVRYSFNDNGVTKELDAKQFREEYEETISQNIEEDIAHLQQELGLGGCYISKADRNVAISKILQREILNNPSRYGIDMLQACSVDENGNFRIPLNDPIQSKRIEQLLNSVIKKMVNKQEIAGGPVVQVSNFGTSRRLSIVFKDKAGNEIRKNDYKPENHDGKSFEEWLAENQDGIAYYEAFAPIYSDELLKFCDKSGFINIEAIDRVNPDLLKMIGYRIPSEDKYSVMPIKIVGFLPREAGDALMLPYEITTITGADFDIDKIYLVRKQIELTRGLEQAIKDELKPNKKDEESIKAYLKERGKRLRAHLSSVLPEDILTQEEKDEIARKIDEEDIVYKDKDGKEVRRKSINQRLLDVGEIHSKNVDRINEIYNKKSDENESKNQSEEKYNKRQDSLDKQLDEKIAEEQAEYEQRIKDIQTERARRYTKELEIANKNKKYERITEFLKGDIFAKSEDPIQNLLRDKYLEFRYGTAVSSEGRAYRDNKIFDMSWATLTHATTTDKILNPGGFDPQKRVGYAVTAYKLGAKKADGTPYTLDELEQMSSSELKDLCYRDKNIVFIDTHAQFYKQNSAAGQILGIFAVAKTAHTALEGYGYAIDIDNALDLHSGKISIFGRTFGGLVDIDKKINFSGERISKILGSLVASAADAVKDPVLNLMNINADTVNVLNIAIRMGIPFEDIAHILSTKTISDALEEYNKRKLNDGSVTLNSVISEKIKKFEKDDKIKYRVHGQTYYSKLYTEDLSKQEVENAIAGKTTRESEYKILKAYERFSKIANEARGLDFCTRFNSIANAMGPLVVDNIAKEYKFNHFGDNVYKKTEGFSFNGQLVGIGDVINIDGKTVVVDDNTLPQLINSGIISRTPTKTKKITQYDVLWDHPILHSFSKTIDLAGELMSDSPLYSQNFRTALVFFGENLTRRLMSKDYRKELSSFGDFYQSAMLIESGAISMDELKYLIEQFPKDFFGKTKVKERYKNNTLIQAIQPDVINLADGKTRTVLSIKTTGLDNIQKEALMMGWAELEKVNPKLSRLLFKYAFFKGGIGFSPKSFMNLAPVPVKTAFKEYVDTFVNGQEVVPEEVVVNFIRNNANNRKLVPVIKEPEFKKSGVYYVTSDYSASRLDFFKISDSPSSVIFRKIMTDENGVSYYESMKPLGNNGEYFEYSKTPINEDAINSETEQNNGIENVADETPVVESVDNSDFDAASALRLLFTDKTIEAHKNYSQEKKNETREQYIKYIDDNLKKKGLELNREQLEEVYKIFC